jgi:Domain of unknown function DUF29
MPTNAQLYEQDFYTWTQTTAALIRAGEWQDLDPESVAEEIESLGISQEHALRSYLKQLVMHLLKWQYQPSRRRLGHSWETTIINARSEIAELVERNPGLAPHVEPLLSKAYPTARRLARVQTRLPLATFPEVCSWTLAQVLDDDFFPEGD